MHDLIPVPFQGDTLGLLDCDGIPYAPMRPIVEGMGLAWQVQHRKIMARFSTCVTEMVTQMPGDDQRRLMTCLPLRKLPGWLMTISPNKVSPELRPKILAYQEECDDALWDYWTQGHASNPRATPDPVDPVFHGTTFDFIARCSFRDGRLVAIGPVHDLSTTDHGPSVVEITTQVNSGNPGRRTTPWGLDPAGDAAILANIQTFLRERPHERWTLTRLERRHGGVAARFGCGQKRMRRIVYRALDAGTLTVSQTDGRSRGYLDAAKVLVAGPTPQRTEVQS